MAGKHNFEVDQGATLQKVFIWRQPAVAPAEEGDPVDLSGFTARMQLRTAIAATDVALELTTENGRIILGDQESATPTFTNGRIALDVAADDMADLASGTYFYDIEMVSETDVVTRLLQGKIKVKPEVTR